MLKGSPKKTRILSILDKIWSPQHICLSGISRPDTPPPSIDNLHTSSITLTLFDRLPFPGDSSLHNAVICWHVLPCGRCLLFMSARFFWYQFHTSRPEFWRGWPDVLDTPGIVLYAGKDPAALMHYGASFRRDIEPYPTNPFSLTLYRKQQHNHSQMPPGSVGELSPVSESLWPRGLWLHCALGPYG